MTQLSVLTTLCLFEAKLRYYVYSHLVRIELTLAGFPSLKKNVVNIDAKHPEAHLASVYL